MTHIIGIIFLGGLFFLAQMLGRESAFKEMDGLKVREDLEEIKKKLSEMQ